MLRVGGRDRSLFPPFHHSSARTDDNKDITAMHSELDSVVDLERSDLSEAIGPQVILHSDLTKGKLPSKSFTPP